MKESDIEGVATHDDPESCAGARKDDGESLTGARTGTDTEPRKQQSRAPTLFLEAEGNTTRGRYREPSSGPARSKTRSTCGTFLRENREVLASPAKDGFAGRARKASGPKPAMHDARKSDRFVAPTKSSNNAAATTASADGARGREALVRYALRPPIAQERLHILPDNLVRIEL